MSQLFNENFKSYRERQDVLSYGDHIEVNQALYEMSKTRHQDVKEQYSQVIMHILSKYEPAKTVDFRTGLPIPPVTNGVGRRDPVSSLNTNGETR